MYQDEGTRHRSSGGQVIFHRSLVSEEEFRIAHPLPALEIQQRRLVRILRIAAAIPPEWRKNKSGDMEQVRQTPWPKAK